jgi:hypothetical protein
MRTLSLHHRALIIGSALVTGLALASLILMRGFTPIAGAADTYVNGFSTDLSISGSGPSSVDRGQAFRDTYTVQNLGPAIAHRVMVTSELPQGVVYDPAGSTPGCRLESSNTVVCELGTLPDNLVRTVTIGMRTPYHDACSENTYQMSATVKSDETDTVSGNNRSATIYTIVRCAPKPTQCADGIDNDRNGRIDLQDPGCTSVSDDFESNGNVANEPISSEERLRLRLLRKQAEVAAAQNGYYVPPTVYVPPVYVPPVYSAPVPYNPPAPITLIPNPPAPAPSPSPIMHHVTVEPAQPHAATGSAGMNQLLPRTGAGDFTRPFEDVTRFLSPL